MRKQPKEKLKKVFLIHGEYESMGVFRDALEDEGYSNIEIPEYGQTFEL